MTNRCPITYELCGKQLYSEKGLRLLSSLHLKNFSLIKQENLSEFSPAYDLVNSSIVMNTSEDLALPLRGKKAGLPGLISSNILAKSA